MFFSDCTFLNPENSLRAALIATDLMREFIKTSVPVRMGLGKGTLDSFGYSTDTVARSLWTASASTRVPYRIGNRGAVFQIALAASC